jgi:ATP-binding cassette subfamily B (MDR/TAP) protein 1
MASEALNYLGYFFAVSAMVFIFGFAKGAIFNLFGDALTRKVRTLYFAALLRRPVAFFDKPANSVGRITSRLTAEASQVRGAVGDAISTAVEGLLAVVVALIIAMAATWQLALIAVGVFPLLFHSTRLEFQSMFPKGREVQAALEEGGNMLNEAIAAVRTVAAFNMQEQLLQSFTTVEPRLVEIAEAKAKRRGFAKGYQIIVQMCANALIFWAGGQFIEKGTISFQQLLRGTP